MVDWNGDGKQDMTDSFIDRELYTQNTGKDGGGVGWLGWLLLGLGLLAVIVLSV